MGSPEHNLGTYSKQPTNTGSTQRERERVKERETEMKKFLSKLHLDSSLSQMLLLPPPWLTFQLSL